jgi:hypothetical protein
MDMTVIAFIAQLLAALYALVKILEYFEIKPQDWILRRKTQGIPVPENLPKSKKWILGTAGLFLLLSVGSASYGFYLIAQRPIRTSACGMKFTQDNFTPKNSAWNSGLRITITPDRERGPVQLLIVCDEAIGLAPKEGKLTKGGQFQVEAQMLMQSHPDVWNVKWRTPTWTSDDSVTFELLSERPIHVKWVLPISYNPGS